MGLMDKVKQQAEQALAKAQQGVSQGQAKLDQVQAKRQADALLRDLGAAYYASQRTGGSQEQVDAAMRLVDEHVAAHGAVDADGPAAPADGDGGEDGGEGDSPSATGSSTPSAPSTGATASGGSFSIEDV
jgi:hypothetical protein